MVYPKYYFVAFKCMLPHEKLNLFSVYFPTSLFPDQNRLHGVLLSYFEYELYLQFGGKDMYRIVTESNMQNSRSSCICLAVYCFILPERKVVCSYLVVFKCCNNSDHIRKMAHHIWRKNIGEVFFSDFFLINCQKMKLVKKLL